MPKRVVIGVVTRDKAPQTRRVEIPRLVRHATYGKTMRRRTICSVSGSSVTVVRIAAS